MRTNPTNQSRWQRVLSLAATVAASAVMAFALTACGSDDGGTPVATVAAPGAPTALTATAGENLVNLSWSPPAASATAGLPTSYVIYVSETATTSTALVDPANLLATVPVVAGQTVYTFTNSGLAGTVTYYYVVTAKNADGETPSTVASAKPTGSPNPVVAGNNFSAALIFADNIGVTNLPLDPAKSWTLDPLAIDFNTGLRPLITETITTLPFLTVPSKVDPLYFEQKTVNTWQGEWAKGAATPQNVTAKWGDNLSSGSLSATGKIRLEMVLTTTVPTAMTTYTMKSLYGGKKNEMFGTNGVVIPSTTAFVFATNAHLQIHKLDASGNKILPAVDDQFLFDTNVPDGLNKLAAEIPVSGNFTYGYVWDPSATGSTAGNYRITFLLDASSQGGTGSPANNTFIKTATNGVRVSDTEAYINIVVQ
ncbi:MAG: hypothetical protein BVN29_17845 [Nitrospira sp. ST-bin5]|nr:MAG: hypothetical protein BVN29_17845 [Nitrospira sp. ST-bin5]